MKKTLYTAALALGLASAASATILPEHSILDDATLALPYYDATTDGYTFGPNQNESTTLSNDPGTGVRTVFTVSVVLHYNVLKDLLEKGDSGSLFYLSVSELSDPNQYAMGLGLMCDEETGALSVVAWSDEARLDTGSIGQSYLSDGVDPMTGTVMVSLTTNNSGLRGYINAAAGNSSYFTLAGGQKVNAVSYDLLTINSAYASAIEQLYVFDAAYVQNSTQLASIYNASKMVPEPTTATLSLLALAGLAARRRRK